ncbi:hypothetical protein BB559_007513 [Furculomyces boomerangus]|uniref:Carbohydrate-binding module family 19 domain-containing protein n=1 Tax=Furculomyces boomerangus TaxID=61424 RepID=A0A2T9XX20_9FUNG|nr:hypothetical protein BB559_007513 [Furculomyces boomerangus]
MHSFMILFALFALAVNAHMAMFEPCTRFTSSNPKCPPLPAGQTYDYDIKTPIGTKDGILSPICKNSTPFPQPVETWTAGQQINAKFVGDGAAHGGGHCQFALSYDGGKTFVVIHDEKRYCFFNGPSDSNQAQVLSYPITIPSTVPAGDHVIFAWSWINAIGNREFYMNCADVAIKSSSQSYSGPEMLIANYGPNTPVIPEFKGNYETGLDLFDSRPYITVYSNGGQYTNNSPSASQPEQQNPQPSQPEQSNPERMAQEQQNPQPPQSNPQPEQPDISNSNKNTSISNVDNKINTGGQGCIDGNMVCSETDLAKFSICDNGSWVQMASPPGTKCINTNDGFVSFDFINT